MNEVERMLIRLVGDGSSYFRMIDLAERDLVRFSRIADRETARVTRELSEALSTLGGKFMAVGKMATIFGGILTGIFGGLILGGLSSAAAFEQTEIAFGTMLGSADLAQKTLADLTKFAAETPFEMPEIEGAARGLVQFGETGSQMMETLEILGNAASGANTRFGELALIFNQVRGVGKLLTEDFRQLSTRGVISLQDVATHFGVTAEEAGKMISAGKVGFEDLRNILKSLSGEGGRFEDMMAKQSKTLGGLWSTFKDNLNLVIRDLGQHFLPLAKWVVDWANWAADSFRNMGSTAKMTVAIVVGLGAALGVMIATLGSMALAIGGAIAGLAQIVAVITTFKVAALLATVAATGLSLAMAAIPVLAALIIGFKVGQAIAGWFDVGGAKALNEELEKTARLNHEILLNQQRGFNETFEGLDARTGEDKKIFAEEELERAERDLKGLEFQINQTKKEAEDLAPTWKSLWQATGDQEVTLGKLDEVQQRYANQQGFIAKIKEQLASMPQPEIRPSEEDVKKADQYLENLKMQAATLGMTKEEAQLYKFELQGINKATIDEIRSVEQGLAVKQKAAEQAAKLDGHVKSLKESLKLSIATWGMSADEIERYKLEQMGAGSITLHNVGILQKELEALKKKKEITDALRSTTDSLTFQVSTLGMDQAESEIEKLEQMGATPQELAGIKDMQQKIKDFEEQKKLIEEGKQLTESLMTKEEQHAASMANVQKLMDAGAISTETYQRAMKNLADEFDGAKQSYEAYQNAISGGREFDTSFEGLTSDLAGIRGPDYNTPEANPDILPLQRKQDLNPNDFVANQPKASGDTLATTGKSSVELLASILEAIRQLVDKDSGGVNIETIEKAA